jgi:hypothetical protein
MDRAREELKRLLKGDLEHDAQEIESFARAQLYRGMAWQAARVIRDLVSEHSEHRASRGIASIKLPPPDHAVQFEQQALHPVQLDQYWAGSGTKMPASTGLLAAWMESIQPIIDRWM